MAIITITISPRAPIRSSALPSGAMPIIVGMISVCNNNTPNDNNNDNDDNENNSINNNINSNNNNNNM